MSKQDGVSRRQFVGGTAAAAMVAAVASRAWAQGGEALKVGLIGCGGRGTGAAQQCVNAGPNITLTAMGDLFADRLAGSRDRLAKLGEGKFAVTDDTAFVGFDAYEKVLACDIDIAILATPPGFRPDQFAAAIGAGKHVFMEKPVAVDSNGIRAIMQAGDQARERGLSVVAGTQRRHDQGYRDTVARIRDGAIGEVVAANCWWNQGGLWNHARKPEWTDMEWQCRNWLYFTWLSGDHIVEQHVHNLDIINWVMGEPPVSAYGMGGREVRIDPKFGHVFDHFCIEYEYANGAKMISMCRQQDGTDRRVAEHVVGTKGSSNCANRIWGAAEFRFQGEKPNPYDQCHVDLINAIRSNQPINEAREVAESTMTAIMGRESAYTGKVVKWVDALNLDLALVPKNLAMRELPVPPVPVPGKYQSAEGSLYDK